ncbi:P-II family nitrogen regulator [Thomasclavelia sp.]
MKKLEIIIRPEKLESLKETLTNCGVTGMMVSNIMGVGNQMGYTQQYRGTKYTVNLVSKLRVETVVKDDIVKRVIDDVTTKLSSGNVGDGKIFVYPVEEAVRIRTSETGEKAL